MQVPIVAPLPGLMTYVGDGGGGQLPVVVNIAVAVNPEYWAVTVTFEPNGLTGPSILNLLPGPMY